MELEYDETCLGFSIRGFRMLRMRCHLAPILQTRSNTKKWASWQNESKLCNTCTNWKDSFHCSNLRGWSRMRPFHEKPFILEWKCITFVLWDSCLHPFFLMLSFNERSLIFYYLHFNSKSHKRPSMNSPKISNIVCVCRAWYISFLSRAPKQQKRRFGHYYRRTRSLIWELVDCFLLLSSCFCFFSHSTQKLTNRPKPVCLVLS